MAPKSNDFFPEADEKAGTSLFAPHPPAEAPSVPQILQHRAVEATDLPSDLRPRPKAGVTASSLPEQTDNDEANVPAVVALRRLALTKPLL